MLQVLSRATPLAFAVLLAFSTAPARAADPTPAPSPVPEIGRVSTSDRHDEPIDRTTRPTFVVDRARIEARGARTVADALAEVPGISIFRYGAFGAQANIVIHGAASQSTLVLLDGVPVAPGSNGQIDIGGLSTVGVRRIEIVEGGGSTLYGTSAVGGVINIITDVPRGTYLAIADGTLGERDLRAGAGNGRLGASFERHVANNAYDFPTQFGAPPTPAPAGTRTNADAQQSAARLAYDVDFDKAYSARVRLGSDEIKIGVPGSLIFGATPVARENVSRDDLQVELARTGATVSTILTLGAHAQRLAYADAQAPPESDTLDGRAQISLRHIISDEHTTFIAGIDLARESAVLTNIGLYDSNFNLTGYTTLGAAQSQSAAYLQEQYASPAGIRAYAGLRGEHDSPLGGVVAPSAGFAVPIGGLRLAANAGTSFRVPTIIDRYYPGFSNPNLKPERAKDADITLQSERILGGASLGWFTRDATNLIQLDAAGTPQNIERASVRGFQATLRTRPLRGITSTLALTDTYRALNFTDGAPVTRLLFTPIVSGTLGIEKLIGAGAVGFGAQAHVFGRHIEGSGPNNDGQTTVDAYVRARVSRDAVLSLRARNLGDERYTPILGYPAPGRTFELELATR